MSVLSNSSTNNIVIDYENKNFVDILRSLDEGDFEFRNVATN
jgi:hypothetical protein